MDFVTVGYYDDRQKARVPIDRGAIRAAFGERLDNLRMEVFEGYIILTDPNDPSFPNQDT